MAQPSEPFRHAKQEAGLLGAPSTRVRAAFRRKRDLACASAANLGIAAGLCALASVVACSDAKNGEGHTRSQFSEMGSPAASNATVTVPASMPASSEPSCVPPTSAADVVLMGESFFAMTGAIPGLLTEHARASGLIGPDESFRDVSVAASEWATGAIGKQLTHAAAEHRIVAAVVNAGLSDIVFADRCIDGADARCVETVHAAGETLAQMGQQGVRDVVFAFYPALWGLGERVQPALATLGPLLHDECTRSAAPRCHFLDLTSSFDGHREYSADGLYPTSAGANVIADSIWQAMLEHCIVPR